MDEEEMVDTTFTWLNFKFKTIRIVENVFTAHTTSLKVEVLMDTTTSERDINIVIEKIHFWFDHIVSNSILFNRDNEFALQVLFDEDGASKTDNFAMVFPEEPTDDVLARAMHSKLNAFGGDKVGFGMIELQSDTRELLTCSYTGYGEYELPPIEEWVGDRSYHSKPWWARDDGDTLDVIPDPDADLTQVPCLGIDMSFIEQRYRRSGDDTAIIIKPAFKPEVISGGKDEPKN